MYFKLCLLYLWIFLLRSAYGQSINNLNNLQDNNLPSNRKLHQCELSNNQYSFDVMPGSGWDNLINQELGQVIKLTYKKCKSSNDGRLLVPDDVIISPIRRSIVLLDSEMFDHYSNYTTMTSKSINIEASHATPHRKISGSFSYEATAVKNDQLREKSKVTRNQLRYEIYEISYQPDIELDEKFKNRILEMGAVLIANEDQLYPKYLADLIVRDFGTHIIRSIEAGAILSKTDTIKSSYAKKYEADDTTIRAAASYSMAQTFNLDVKASQSTTNQNLNEYNSNCASTRINTVGGKIFGSKFSMSEWEKSIDENLVVVDRRGVPIFNVITPSTVNEFESRTLFQITKLIEEAVDRYYESNIRYGCMDMLSPNFNADANVDSGDCKDPEIKFNFGGIYQNCFGDNQLCSEISQTNPATGSMSCPQGFDPILLQHEQYKCRKECTSYFIVLQSCRTRCSNYALYWCSPNSQSMKDSGYLFGGSYTNSLPNPITNANTCPQYYMTLKFGANAMICLTNEIANGFKDSISFGGFYSCSTGNSLSDDNNPNHTTNSEYWTKSCARGYASHLITVDRTCQISYCAAINTKRITGGPPIIRPPFIDIGFGPNLTTTLSFQTPFGVKLKLSQNGSWKESPEESKISPMTIVTATLGSILLTIVIAGFGLVVYRYRLRRLNKVSNTDTEMMINDSNV